jgi:hypothetical protein
MATKWGRGLDDDQALQRIINKNNTGGGTNLPPRVIGGRRVPVVDSLRLLEKKRYFGGTEFSIAWQEPVDIQNDRISHFNVYIIGLLSKNQQPIGPYSTRRSPAILRVQTQEPTPIVFIVQTVLLSGMMSSLEDSPSISSTTFAGSFLSEDYPVGSIPLNALANGIAGELITWNSSGIITTIPTGANEAILRGNGSGSPPSFSSKAGLNIPEGRSNLINAGRLVMVGTTPGFITEAGIVDDGDSINLDHSLKLPQKTDVTVLENGLTEFNGKKLSFTLSGKRKNFTLTGPARTSNISVTNTITETAVFLEEIPENSVNIGTVFNLKLFGHYSSNTTDNFTIRLKYGGTTILSLSSPTLAVTNVPISISATLTVRTLGSNGTLVSFLETSFNGTLQQNTTLSPVTIDTTVNNNLEITIEWSAADIDNSLTITQGFLSVTG